MKYLFVYRCNEFSKKAIFAGCLFHINSDASSIVKLGSVVVLSMIGGFTNTTTKRATRNKKEEYITAKWKEFLFLITKYLFGWSIWEELDDRFREESI